jgi:hypothetical protein
MIGFQFGEMTASSINRKLNSISQVLGKRANVRTEACVRTVHSTGIKISGCLLKD